jgi:hypothetical protein
MYDKQAVEEHEEGSEQGFEEGVEEADGLEESLLSRPVVKPTQEQLQFITTAATESNDTGPEAWKEYHKTFPDSPLTQHGFLCRFRRERGIESPRYKSPRYNWTIAHVEWFGKIQKQRPFIWKKVYKKFLLKWPENPPTLKAMKSFLLAHKEAPGPLPWFHESVFHNIDKLSDF